MQYALRDLDRWINEHPRSFNHRSKFLTLGHRWRRHRLNKASRQFMRKGALRIGTSGWHYASWWGPFFPAGLKKADALRYYASRFTATELNAPFYRTPTLEAVQGWFDQTPEDFRFSWKASKFITHWKRLGASSANSLELLETRLGVLRHKVGPILFQLPPRMTIDHARLEAFIAMLDPARQYSFEFRDPSWYDDTIFDLLHRHDIALCLSDHAAAPAPRKVTASFVYVRNHGPGGRYHGNYADAALDEWASHIAKWRKRGAAVWVFFDNDVKSAAPRDAARLVTALST
jgi:uncharacterized protein YecE (DUF72 family)